MAAALAVLICALVGAAVLGAASAAPVDVDRGVDAAAVVPARHGPLAFDGRTVVYTVRPGDTLWDLAAGLAPGSDPRPVVDLIRRINGLSTSSLGIGQELLLPAR